MGAAFIFFVMERNSVAEEYRTTMTISALIVGIAAFHYYYMRGAYVEDGIVSVHYRIHGLAHHSPTDGPQVP